MKKTILYTLLFIGANASLILLPGLIDSSFAEAFYSIWYNVALLTELIVGAILVAKSKTKEIGKGLLLAAAVLLLVGFSVCSGIWS